MARFYCQPGSTNHTVFRYTADAARGAGNDIFLGDLIILEADGNVTRLRSASSSAVIVGVAVGLFDSNGIPVGDKFSSVSNRYLPNATAGSVDVMTSPHGLYMGLTSAAATNETHRGNNVDIANGTDDTTLGIPGATIDVATYATTATLPLRLVDFVRYPGVKWGDSSIWVIVAANQHHFRQTTGV